MDQVVNKIQKDIRDNDIKKSIQEYSEVGKYIMQCWRRSWNEYLTSDANIRICSYSEYWKELFGDQKEEDK